MKKNDIKLVVNNTMLSANKLPRVVLALQTGDIFDRMKSRIKMLQSGKMNPSELRYGRQMDLEYDNMIYANREINKSRYSKSRGQKDFPNHISVMISGLVVADFEAIPTFTFDSCKDIHEASLEIIKEEAPDNTNIIKRQEIIEETNEMIHKAFEGELIKIKLSEQNQQK